MIDKQVARDLLPLVHSEYWGDFLKYVAYRKEVLSKAAMLVAAEDAWRNAQGAYQEMQLLEDLQKWVEQDSKDQ